MRKLWLRPLCYVDWEEAEMRARVWAQVGGKVNLLALTVDKLTVRSRPPANHARPSASVAEGIASPRGVFSVSLPSPQRGHATLLGTQRPEIQCMAPETPNFHLELNPFALNRTP